MDQIGLVSSIIEVASAIDFVVKVLPPEEKRKMGKFLMKLA